MADKGVMGEREDNGHPGHETVGNHFSCSMSSVLLGEIRDFGGDVAVAELLDRAGSTRTHEYLTDITNWISYDEANALWEAGTQLTHHPRFPRVVGERAARRLKGSPVAGLLRSLGSPEAVYRQMSVTATKFSAVSRLEATDTGPGYANITSKAVGFPAASPTAIGPWGCCRAPRSFSGSRRQP